jgi:Mg-chelatase subunit ChlD
MTAHGVSLAAVAAAFLALGPQQPSVFRTRADVVAIDVTVMDGRRPMTSLTKDDFELRDNGVVQTIDDFERERLPLDVTFTIDLSGSMTPPKLARIERAVAQVGEAMRAGDRSAVLTFTSVVTEQRAMQPPPIVLQLATDLGTTSIVDALLLALISGPLVDRRQLGLFMTDGEDGTSVFDVSTTIETARYASTQMSFVVVRDGPLPKGSILTMFRTVAETTGGDVIHLDKDDDLSKAFLGAVESFRTSYVLRYAPKGVSGRGWHEIHVATKNDKYTVRARRGYWADR